MFGLSGTAVAGLAAAAIGAYGANRAANTNAEAMKNASSTTQNTLDPRISTAIFGADGTGGILGRNTELFDRQQDPLMQQYGTTMQQYLGGTGKDMNSMRTAATGLMNGGGLTTPQIFGATQNVAQVGNVSQGVTNQGFAKQGVASMNAAQAGAPSQVSSTDYQAAQINAPAQNSTNLAPAYQDMVYGAAGANPYLTGAIGKGINQSNNAFTSMQQDSTRNLLENVMPSIRSNSILSGQYGGSRQGIAEGRAIGDFGREQQRMIGQMGQNNTDAAVAAQAGAYDADRNRSLSAMSGLGSQQYGVAQQQASMDTQAAAANAAAANAASMANAGFKNSNDQFNAGLTQQSNLTNTGAQNTAFGADAGREQQAMAANAGAANTAAGADATRAQGAATTNAGAYNNAYGANAQMAMDAQRANQSAQLQTNNLYSNNIQSGLGALTGLQQTAANAGANQDAYALNQASKVNSLLTPYVGLGSGSTSSQPLYQNQGGNLLAGATAGLGLARQIGSLFNTNGNTASGQGAYGGANTGQYYDGYGYVNY